MVINMKKRILVCILGSILLFGLLSSCKERGSLTDLPETGASGTEGGEEAVKAPLVYVNDSGQSGFFADFPSGKIETKEFPEGTGSKSVAFLGETYILEPADREVTTLKEKVLRFDENGKVLPDRTLREYDCYESMAETGKGSLFVSYPAGKENPNCLLLRGKTVSLEGMEEQSLKKVAADWLVQNCSFPAAAEDGVLFSSTTREEAGFVPGAKAYTLYFKEKLGGLTVRSADVQISSEGIVLLVRDVEVERYRSLLSGLTAESIGAGLEARLREENPQMEDFRVKVDADSLWFFEGEEGLNADFSAECIGTEGGKTFKETFVGWMLLE